MRHRADKECSRPLALILLVLVLAVSSENSVLAEPEAAVERQTQSWLARAYLPDTKMRLGEVRVTEEDGGLRIRTLLYSNLLKRIVAEIEMKCEEGWPEGSRYRGDSRRYVAALAAARGEVWSRWHSLANRDRLEKTQTLVIDFIVTSQRTAIEIGIPTLDESDGERRVTGIEALGDESYPDAFVYAEALRILEDQFPQRAAELAVSLPPRSQE